MAKMNRAEEQAVIDGIASDHDDEDAWELDEPVEPSRRRRLGTQLSVRIDEERAERLRDIAERHGIGYTSLVRMWIEQRIDEEFAPAVSPPMRVMAALSEARIEEQVQITGSARLVPT